MIRVPKNIISYQLPKRSTKITTCHTKTNVIMFRHSQITVNNKMAFCTKKQHGLENNKKITKYVPVECINTKIILPMTSFKTNLANIVRHDIIKISTDIVNTVDIIKSIPLGYIDTKIIPTATSLKINMTDAGKHNIIEISVDIVKLFARVLFFLVSLVIVLAMVLFECISLINIFLFFTK